MWNRIRKILKALWRSFRTRRFELFNITDPRIAKMMFRGRRLKFTDGSSARVVESDVDRVLVEYDE